jgi:hypothetical protein
MALVSPLRLPKDGVFRGRDGSRLGVGEDMRRQKGAIVARRLRQSVTSGRLAAWLSFAGAVLSQASLLAGGYFLSDPTAANALRNAGIAGGLIVVGRIVMILARRYGKRAQSTARELGRIDLRLVAETAASDEKQQARPAA